MWSESFIDVTDVLLTNKLDGVPPLTKADLMARESLVIGGIRGYKYECIDSLERATKHIRYDVDSIEALLKLLIKNRVDAVVINADVVKRMAKRDAEINLNQFTIGEKVSSAKFRLQCNNNEVNKMLLNYLDGEILKLKETGKIESIIKKYLGN